MLLARPRQPGAVQAAGSSVARGRPGAPSCAVIVRAPVIVRTYENEIVMAPGLVRVIVKTHLIVMSHVILRAIVIVRAHVIASGNTHDIRG